FRHGYSERKWLHYKESFQDYALDKLAILRCLKLPDDSIIHCLIDGISDRPIKSSAAVIKTNSVGKFLEEMHHLTATCGTPWKKSPTFKPKFEKPKIENDSSSKADPQSKISMETFCVYCRAKDHTREKCLKLKKKEQLHKPPPPTTVSQVSTTEEPPDDTLDSVAFVENTKGRKIVTNCVLIKDSENKLQLLSEVASADIIENSPNKTASLFEEISIDFDYSIKNQLIAIFQEVENTEVPILDDDYSVKICVQDRIYI
ncbi:hypothetical protein RF55_17870, partial [Lasius niger]